MKNAKVYKIHSKEYGQKAKYPKILSAKFNQSTTIESYCI